MDAFELPEPIDGPDKEANERALQTKLAEYRQALEEEFEVGVKYEDGRLTPTEIRDRTKELLTGAVPKAVARMLYLVEHGKTEQVQLKASQFIIEAGIGKDGGGLVGDPLENLLTQINATK